MSSQTAILSFADPDYPLIGLANQLPWGEIETSLVKSYPPKKHDHKPIRLMAGLLMLKYFHDLTDEDTIENWMSNPYFQYLTGETIFQWDAPCEPEDLEHFEECIGPEFTEELLKASVILLEAQDSEFEEFEEFEEED
jgi:IS5 family transposase